MAETIELPRVAGPDGALGGHWRVIVRNDEQITIHFILFSANISLIWEIVFVFALGLLGGVLLSQLSRRRRAQRGGQPADRGGDLSRGGQAEGETRG